jgi:hypothetical protein
LAQSNLEVLHKLTGLTKEEMESIWQDVKANSKKLEECPCHDFSIDLTPDKIIGKKYQCTKCGGTIDDYHKRWYDRGVQHGRRQANGSY